MDQLGSRLQETICALATPWGRSAIAVIRVSGPQSHSLLGRLSPKFETFIKKTADSKTRVLVAELFDLRGELLDEVVLTVFFKGRSFTGEDTVEISCHGNPQLVETVLSELIELGACPARAGEFTMRAFLNNRMDLVKAESVLAMIESESRWGQKKAVLNLRGQLSKELDRIQDELVSLLAQLEVSLDFFEEGFDVLSRQTLRDRLKALKIRLDSWLESSKRSVSTSQGIKVGFLGRPNAGKSSLFNLLLHEDRSIVSPMAGTTRDVVEAQVRWDKLLFCLQDSAGLRASEDPIELQGLKRARRVHAEADLVLFVFDGLLGWTSEDSELLREFLSFPGKAGNPILFIATKRDLGGGCEVLIEAPPQAGFLHLNTQDLDQRSSVLDLMSQIWLQSASLQEESTGQIVLLQARQIDLVRRAVEALQRAGEMAHDWSASEFCATDVRLALDLIHELQGRKFDDEILDRVFRDFCIGK
ncbi:MAG: tRNA uridine-5-carboxymethylaminomethyl(34) synthesis GTPase MnmE [Bdellovibrio sp.]